jgi:hypothetical protein
MEFEQWKLLRESEEKTGLRPFYEELGSANRFFTIFLAAIVLISITAVTFIFLVSHG